jgi:hypothetical protein
MSYYTNTQGLYYNSQFDVDKVKQKIYTIRNLQGDLTEDIRRLHQVYDFDQQQQNSITLLNNRMTNNVKIINKVEESKLEI